MIDHADPERESLRADEARRLSEAFKRGAIGAETLRVSLMALGRAAQDVAAEIALLRMELAERRAPDARVIQLNESRNWLKQRRGSR